MGILSTPGGHGYLNPSDMWDLVTTARHSEAIAMQADRALNDEKTTRANEDARVKTEAVGEAVATTGFRNLEPSTGYSAAFLDAEDRVTELALDLAGQVPQWILDRWRDRLGLGVSGGMDYQREALVDAYRRRRGRVIGTAGASPVTLRFDHGWNAFRDKVLPLLRARSLPALQMVNPASMTDAANNTVTYTDIQGWWLSDGIEVANHGQSHGTATTDPEIEHHIVGALTEIQANLPKSPVELYVPGGITGSGDNTFSGSTTKEFYATSGGRLAMKHHAAISGYMPGMYRAMPANLDLGMGHASADTWTVASVKAALDEVVRDGAGLTIMWHPDELDTTGKTTTAQLTEILDYLVTLRDAGKVEVLTQTGALLADPFTTRRHDLITDGEFREGLIRWSNTTGWSTATSNGISYATTTTGGLLRQFETGRHVQQVEGSNRELFARFRAPAGAVVRVSVTSGTNGLAASREVTLPASTTWTTVRQAFSIPTGAGALTFDVGRVSGGAVDVTDIRAQSI